MSLAVGLSKESLSATSKTYTPFKSCKFFLSFCKCQKIRSQLNQGIQHQICYPKNYQAHWWVIIRQFFSVRSSKNIWVILMIYWTEIRRPIYLTVLKKQTATSSYDLLIIWDFSDSSIHIIAMWKWLSSFWSSCQQKQQSVLITGMTWVSPNW